MKEGQPNAEGQADLVSKLQAKIKGYEDLMGKIAHTAYPTGKIHDHSEFTDGKHFIFGFVTDTHLGSTHERLHDLDETYKIFQTEGITTVYHAGDIVAGGHVYRGQENELKVWGLDNQAQYVADQYPKIDGMKTYFITGNHDLSFLNDAGADIGIVIEKKRKDLIYLDQVESNVKLSRTAILRLWHGGGGTAYALSYKGQRLVASLESGVTKPKIILAGHYHQPVYFDYRNVHYLQGGAFERQTIWLKRLGIQPSCSAWIVECHMSDGMINRFKPELIKFFG
jgi:predicted phosphodiesterase